MTTRLHLVCDGCFKEVEGGRLSRHFESFNGRGYGFGVIKTPAIDDAVPDGWVWSDPYTHCTYCPECWESIENSEDAA